MTRIRRWVKDPFPGLSHLLGAFLSVAAMIVLLEMSVGKPWRIVAFAIYGASMISLYLASAAAHSIYCSPAAEKWLDRCDYMAIFLLIAGTYTPVCLIGLREKAAGWAWTILAVEWLLALVGIALILFRGGMSNLVRSIIYVSMAWLAIFAAVPVMQTLSHTAILWMIGGGILYSVGAAVFVLDRPHLWPGRFQAHDLWHCMVLGGSTCHFILMLCIIG
ncbi:MAG TPA: hemolysin III family protein [Tepidisphaeraceae bacterium]|nr:hemolysin III family protein [Tepidisphaeraceae bacterium]